MQNNSWIWWVLIVIIIIGGGWWFYTTQSAAVNVPPTTNNGTPTPGNNPPVSQNPATATVTYDGTKFSPQMVTVRPGGTVTFMSTGGNMWVASAAHPTHMVYGGTNLQTHCAANYTGEKAFDQCKAGTSYSFTFNKTGTWNYHDHINASAFGSVVVQ